MLVVLRSDAKAVTHVYAAPGEYRVAIWGDMGQFGFGKRDWGKEDDREKLVDIVQWGCVQLTQTGYQFYHCSKLGRLSAHDVPDLSGVTSMEFMFCGASSFQADLSAWNVSGVTFMEDMFSVASSFQADLSAWDVSGVTSMESMFCGASSFQADLSAWDVSGTSMDDMFSAGELFFSIVLDG